MVTPGEMDDALSFEAGCGQTAGCTSGMTCRVRSTRENRRFSSVEKRPEDMFHGQLAVWRKENCHWRFPERQSRKLPPALKP